MHVPLTLLHLFYGEWVNWIPTFSGVVLTWVILAQLDFTGKAWLLFLKKTTSSSDNWTYFRPFLIIFNHSQNFTLWVHTSTSNPPRSSYNDSRITNYKSGVTCNTATGPILGFSVLLKDTSVCIMQGSRTEPLTFFHWSDHTTSFLIAGRRIKWGEQAEGSWTNTGKCL